MLDVSNTIEVRDHNLWYSTLKQLSNKSTLWITWRRKNFVYHVTWDKIAHCASKYRPYEKNNRKPNLNGLFIFRELTLWFWRLEVLIKPGHQGQSMSSLKNSKNSNVSLVSCFHEISRNSGTFTLTNKHWCDL